MIGYANRCVIAEMILFLTGLSYFMMRSSQGLCKFWLTLVSNIGQVIMYVALYQIAKRQMGHKGRD